VEDPVKSGSGSDGAGKEGVDSYVDDIVTCLVRATRKRARTVHAPSLGRVPPPGNRFFKSKRHSTGIWAHRLCALEACRSR
jgi:hypothetical protein